MFRKLSIALLLASVTILTSCTRTIYVEPQPLPLPTEPSYPRIHEDALQCLSKAAYTALVERDALKSKAIGECRAVIESTH